MYAPIPLLPFYSRWNCDPPPLFFAFSSSPFPYPHIPAFEWHPFPILPHLELYLFVQYLSCTIPDRFLVLPPHFVLLH